METSIAVKEQGSDSDGGLRFDYIQRPEDLAFSKTITSNPTPACRRLCTECQEIDFHLLANLDVAALRAPDVKARGLPVALLGARCISPPKNGCALCQFFHDAIREIDASSESLELRAFSFLQTYFFFEEHHGHARDLSLEQDLVCFHVVDSGGSWSPTIFKQPNQHLFVRDSRKDNATLFTPSIVPSQIEFDVIHQWLDYCQFYHPCCHVQFSETPGLHLIDCYTQTVVKQQHREEYLALSYVWGSVKPGTLQTMPLPKTICDALFLTKALGFRYLWIDQYCINQNDPQDKLRQIQQMDLIYRNAVMTIIAASGIDASSGLAGINETPRKKQSRLPFGDLTLINTMTGLHHVISHSVWSTRGWTLQEGALTIRRLVFTEEQMYFECAAMNCHESIIYDLPELHRVTKDWTLYQAHPAVALGAPKRQERRAPNTSLSIGNQLLNYYSLRRAYTKRKLTYETDSLNAFLGILKQLELARSSEGGEQIFRVFHYWGLPCLDSSTNLLEGRLKSFIPELVWNHPSCFWKPDSVGMKRRFGFPSWSWVGWEGEVSGERSSFELHWNPPEITVQVTALELEYDNSTRIAFTDMPAMFKNEAQDYSRPSSLHFKSRIVPCEEIEVKFDQHECFNLLHIKGKFLSLHLSTGPRDADSLKEFLKNGRYFFVIMYQMQLSTELLLLEDHSEFCTRVGSGSIYLDADHWPKTFSRHIRLV